MLTRYGSGRFALRGVAAVGTLLGCLAWGDIVLLDEYWAPEITVNDVVAAEIDAASTGSPQDARSGEVAALLTNQTGWPNVRFRAAAMVTLGNIPLPGSEARLWYRTDAWDGRWRLELWVHLHGVTPVPVKALEASLNGGGKGGCLLTDNQWHQAAGPLVAAEAYADLPKGQVASTYVWLVPVDGWNKPHRTLVDRCEIGRPGAPADAAPAPARRIRPKPGFQTAGPGWVWWEAEDAVRHDFPAGGAYAVFTAEQQTKLSNGDWLQWHDCAGRSAMWHVAIAEAGTYALWMRASLPDGRHQLRWDGADWRVFDPQDVEPLDLRLIHDRGGWLLQAGWVRLGEVTLAAGSHTLETWGLPGAGGAALDCWLLTRGRFTPAAFRKPADH
jgi:hypothetical protein